MRLKLIASLLALCLIFSIGSALAHTGMNEYGKTTGAQTGAVSGMTSKSCGTTSYGKMTGTQTGASISVGSGKLAAAYKAKTGGMISKTCGTTSYGKMARTQIGKMTGTKAAYETGTQDC